MSDVMTRNVDKMKEILESDTDIKSLERMKYRLSDAIREGSKVSDQAYSWVGENDSMCALSAAVTAAKARGYM